MIYLKQTNTQKQEEGHRFSRWDQGDGDGHPQLDSNRLEGYRLHFPGTHSQT